MPSFCYMNGHVLSSVSHANVICVNCVFLSYFVFCKTAFLILYIRVRLPALVCSILNVVDTVRTVKVLYSTSASFYWMCVSVY